MKLLPWRACSAIVLAALASGCGDQVNSLIPAAPPPEALKVVLSSRAASLDAGGSVRLTARVTNAAGESRAVNVLWASSQPEIATVSDGEVVALAAGRAEIVASATGATPDTAVIEVLPSLSSTVVVPNAVEIPEGESIRFTADLGLGASPSWQLSDSSVASIDADGNLVALQEGDISLTATAGAVSASADVKVVRATVVSLTVSPTVVTLTPGQTARLQATPRNWQGEPINNEKASFSSSDPSVATVNTSGMVTAISRGFAIVTARAGSLSAATTVNVAPPSASSITVSLSANDVSVGGTVDAQAVVKDAAGSIIPDAVVAWQSGNPAIATVTSSGTVTGIVAGTTTIAAISGGKVASAPIRVDGKTPTAVRISPAAPDVPVGGSAQLAVEVLDQSGLVIPGLQPTVSSAQPHIASVSSSGLLTGVSGGSATITATYGGLSTSATASVTSAAVFSVSLSPSTLAIDSGATAALSAVPRGVEGQALIGRVVSYSSSNPAVASVTTTGIVRGVKSGSATITATSEGKSATSSVTVRSLGAPANAAVARVDVVLNSSSLTVGQGTQAAATVYDAAGNRLTGRNVLFTVSDPSLASVTVEGGVVSTRAAGSVAIIATSEGKSGAATLTISAPPQAPVATVMVQVVAEAIAPLGTTNTIVTLKDAAGNVLTGRTVAYTSLQPAIATASAAGLVTGVAPGSATIRVTSGGVSGSDGIVVQTGASPSPVLTTLTLQVAATSLAVGTTDSVRVTGRDQFGQPMPLGAISFSSSNSAVLSVTSSGKVFANSAGTATVTATSAGKSGSVAITVTSPASPTPVPVSSVALSLSPASIAAGATAQGSAITKDANGSTLSGRIVTYSSSNASVAAVNSSGTVSGISAGSATITATSEGKSGTAAITVTAPTAPTNPTTPITLPALPQVTLNHAYPTVTGRTIVVNAGDNLQSALNTAVRGDEIVLQAGATFTGIYTLPAKTGTAANGWILIRSSAMAQMPAGVRVTPAQAALMPKIVTPDYQSALSTALTASGWYIAGVEISVASTMTGTNNGIMRLGDGGSAQNSTSNIAQDLVLDRVYLHGLSNTNTKRCLSLNSGRTTIKESYLGDCHGNGFDAQAIAGWNGPGPYKIFNNTIAGSGENIIFGGGDPTIANLTPSDIEIRRNYVVTPASWKGVWMKKNLFELKHAKRVLVEDNVFDGSWADGQTGFAFVLKSTNQAGACTWCATTDVTIRGNIIRNAGAGFNLAGAPDAGVVATPLARVLIEGNLVENIATAPYVGDGRLVQLIAGARDIVIRRNTMTGSGSLQTLMSLDVNATSNVEFSANLASLGLYGVKAGGYTAGSASWNLVQGTRVWSATLIGPSQSGYPSGTTFVSSLLAGASASVGVDVTSLTARLAGVIVP